MAYEQKEVELFGTKYKFQKVPNYQWLEARYNATDKNGQLIPHKLYDYIIENIIAEPKTSINEFDCVEELEQVMTEAINFQQRKFKQ